MKKLLSILGSISLVASSASTVLACTDNSSKQVAPESQQTKDIRDQSIDALKSYVLADQYGLDLNKTKEKITVQPGYEVNDTFSTPDSSVIKGLNLDGRTGKDNLPLYGLQDTINNLLGKIKVGPVEINKYIDQFGGIIKQLPALLNENNIDGLLSLVPTILTNVTQFVPKLSIDPNTITWIANWIKMNIKYVLSEFNFNDRVAEIVDKVTKENGKCTLADIYKEGVNSLVNLGNIFFSGYQYTTNGFDVKNGDEATSAFLGTEIFTPLFNKKDIDTDKIKKIFSPAMLMANIKPILDNTANFLSALLFRLSGYLPMMAKTPVDQDNLFDKDKAGDTSNDAVFKKYDAAVVTHDKDGNLFLDDSKTPDNISLNASIFGTISLLADDDPKNLSIVKLTNVLFRNTSVINPLTSKISYLLVDALKFTDYTVSFKQAVDIKVGTLTVDINFKLKDLFNEGTINLVDPIPLVVAQALWPLSKSLTIVAKVSANNGILNNSDYFSNLVEAIITGRKITANSLGDYIKAIIGKDGDGFEIVEHATFLISKDQTSALSQTGAFGLIWDIFSGKIVPILDGILTTMWYTDGDKFFKALVSSGFVKQEQADELRNTMSAYLPLGTLVKSKMQNTPIGDLGELSNVLNLDSIINILNIMFLRNTIQDQPVNNKTQFDDADDNQDKSLFEQILLTLNDPADKKAQEWNYYLGYTTDKSEGPVSSKYALRKGLIGNIIDALYPKLDEYKDKIKGLEQVSGSDTKIGIAYLPLVPSDVMKKLGELMAKFSKELDGKNLNYIVKPLYDNDQAWTTNNVINKYFNGTNDVQYESYDLTFDSSSVTIYDTDDKGNKIQVPAHKGTYRIWFSRTDNKSKFEFKKIEKIS